MTSVSDHFDDRAVALREPILSGKKIALAIGGGIAATQSVRLIRMLRRYGAEVQVYASTAALQFTTPTALTWASPVPPLLALSGSAEHLFTADLLIVAPATLNLITKASLGIADSLISTLIASTLGRMQQEQAGLIPQMLAGRRRRTRIMMVPSMHESLAAHPRLAEYQKQLEALGAHWLSPLSEEGKWKTPSVETIAFSAARALSTVQPFAITDKKIFITAGSVPSYIDKVRMITNIATGKTGSELAWFAYAMGAHVTLLIEENKLRGGPFPGFHSPSDFPFEVLLFRDYDEYYKKTFDSLQTRQPDFAIFTAAVGDVKVKTVAKGKIPSDALSVLDLEGTEKIIRKVRQDYDMLKIIAFKLEAKLTVEKLITTARKQLSQEGYNCVVANRLEDFATVESSAAGVERSAEVPRYIVFPQTTRAAQKSEASLLSNVFKVTHNFDLAQRLFAHPFSS